MNDPFALAQCVHGVLLASRGVTGPRYVFEGPNGLAHAVGVPIDIDWDSEKLDCFDRLALKSYNTAVPGQSSIFCMLKLRKAHAIDPSQVDSIEDAVFRAAYDFMGGGSFGPKTDAARAAASRTTKEQPRRGCSRPRLGGRSSTRTSPQPDRPISRIVG